jgi:hypothetical protein
MTFERSHGKLRLTAKRPSDLEPVDTDARRERDHHADGRFKPGNRAGVNCLAKHSLTKTLREARQRLREALSNEVPPREADRLLDASYRRFDAARRDLGAESVLVLSPLARWAANEVLCDHFAERASSVGLETPAGDRLLARRDALEGRANRALTTALAAAGAVTPGASTTRDAVHARILGASKQGGRS